MADELLPSERKLLNTMEERAIDDLRAKHDWAVSRRGPFVDGAISIGTSEVLQLAADRLGDEHSLLDNVRRRAESGRMFRLAAFASGHQAQIQFQIDRCLNELQKVKSRAAANQASSDSASGETKAAEPTDFFALSQARREAEQVEIQKWRLEFQAMETAGLKAISRRGE